MATETDPNDKPRDGANAVDSSNRDNSTPDPIDSLSPEALRAELDRIRKEKEETAAALKKANAEAADRRRRLNDLEAAEHERQRSKLSEEERQKLASEEREQRAKAAEDRAALAERTLVEERIGREVERAAMELGFQYPTDVPKLVDRDRIRIDEDGRILGVKDAVERLAKDRPGILTATRSGGSPAAIRGRGQGGGVDASQPRISGRSIDPYEQELLELGRGGRM